MKKPHSVAPGALPAGGGEPAAAGGQRERDGAAAPPSTPPSAHRLARRPHAALAHHRVFSDPTLKDLGSRYELGEVIGEGSFGTVHAATRRSDGLAVAVKLINKASLTTPTALAEARTEAEALSLCAGPGVVRLFDWGEDAHAAFYVLERCDGGELFDVLARRGALPEPEAAAVFAAAAAAVGRCHQLGIVHRDVKPENFLLASSVDRAASAGVDADADAVDLAFSLRLTDFGLSAYAPGPGDAPLSEVVGSCEYIAPEVLRRSYGRPADLWSLGCVLYVLLSGLPPFWGRNDREVMDRVLAGAIDLQSQAWARVSGPAKDLVARLLDRDPASRLTASEALAHPWIVAGGKSEAGIPCASPPPPPSSSSSDDGAAVSPPSSVLVSRLAGYGSANALRRAALRHAAGRAPPTRTAGLRRLFASLDADGDGRVTPAELAAGLARAGGLRRASEPGERAAAEAAAADAVRAVGGGEEASSASASSSLSSSAFVAAAAGPGELTHASDLRAAFASFDADGDGALDADEVAQALAAHGLPGGLAAAASLVAAADTNGDGRVDWAEFERMVCEGDGRCGGSGAGRAADGE